MGENESRPVLHVQIAAELQRRQSLNRVHEDGDGRKVVADRQLAASEDGPAGDAELAPARLALPNAAAGIGVNGRALAVWAERSAAVIGEPDSLKPRVGFIVGHPKDAGEAEIASLGGKEEMLGHRPNNQHNLLMSVISVVSVDGNIKI